MGVNWIDTTRLSFRSLLLLESVQISWLSQYVRIGNDLAIALKANPEVDWFLRHKCPEISTYLDSIVQLAPTNSTANEVHEAEQKVLVKLNDWLTYVIDPSIYDRQPFLGWDSNELLSIVDFTGKVVIDVGAGTGRLSFVAAPVAKVVCAVEPVGNLRSYMSLKAQEKGIKNFYAVDGLISRIPFPDGFADVTMGGHVLEEKLEWAIRDNAEMERVTKKGGMVIYCPGCLDVDSEVHHFLMADGYNWSRFEEPVDGWRRKYWKKL
ncbi:MAG TPA: methyltransferase domain-containing protein [Dehalococcoidales bacterium]